MLHTQGGHNHRSGVANRSPGAAHLLQEETGRGVQQSTDRWECQGAAVGPQCWSGWLIQLAGAAGMEPTPVAGAVLVGEYQQEATYLHCGVGAAVAILLELHLQVVEEPGHLGNLLGCGIGAGLLAGWVELVAEAGSNCQVTPSCDLALQDPQEDLAWGQGADAALRDLRAPRGA